jgi:hypothetical protein
MMFSRLGPPQFESSVVANPEQVTVRPPTADVQTRFVYPEAGKSIICSIIHLTIPIFVVLRISM